MVGKGKTISLIELINFFDNVAILWASLSQSNLRLIKLEPLSSLFTLLSRATNLFYNFILNLFYLLRIEFFMAFLHHMHGLKEDFGSFIRQLICKLSEVEKSLTFLYFSSLCTLLKMLFSFVSVSLNLGLGKHKFQNVYVISTDIEFKSSFFVQYITQPVLLSIKELGPRLLSLTNYFCCSLDSHLG